MCSFSWYRRVLKEIQGQAVLWVEWEQTKEEDCGFVTHFPGPWISVLLLRTALYLSLAFSFLQNTGSFLLCCMTSGASCCLADVEYQK